VQMVASHLFFNK